MTATAFIQIEKISKDKTEATFLTGYAWDSDILTNCAYTQAKEKFEVPFDHADYLIDLYSEANELKDTFPIAELGYRSLTQQHS